jgi:hypothetical protein
MDFGPMNLSHLSIATQSQFRSVRRPFRFRSRPSGAPFGRFYEEIDEFEHLDLVGVTDSIPVAPTIVKSNTYTLD